MRDLGQCRRTQRWARGRLATAGAIDTVFGRDGDVPRREERLGRADVYAEGGGLPDEAPVWEHTSTFSVLSFVLASKRDIRFVHHVSSEAVFAFESGAQDLGGNVYIYRGAPPRVNWAKQAILKIDGGPAGSLLGVGLMKVQDKVAILALCEGELVILHGVL